MDTCDRHSKTKRPHWKADKKMRGKTFKSLANSYKIQMKHLMEEMSELNKVSKLFVPDKQQNKNQVIRKKQQDQLQKETKARKMNLMQYQKKPKMHSKEKEIREPNRVQPVHLPAFLQRLCADELEENKSGKIRKLKMHLMTLDEIPMWSNQINATDNQILEAGSTTDNFILFKEVNVDKWVKIEVKGTNHIEMEGKNMIIGIKLQNEAVKSHIDIKTDLRSIWTEKLDSLIEEQRTDLVIGFRHHEIESIPIKMTVFSFIGDKEEIYIKKDGDKLRPLTENEAKCIMGTHLLKSVKENSALLN